MSLNHIISQQRRRDIGPSIDIDYADYVSGMGQVGPTPTLIRASSGTFVNENGRIVGKTKTVTPLNPLRYPVGSVVTIDVPPGDVVGWLDGAAVVIMQDLTGDDKFLLPDSSGDGHNIAGNIIHKTDTTLTLKVTGKIGTTIASNWWVSYRGARRDHDPVSLKCPGLLVERNSTNFVTHSGEMHLWTGNGTRVLSTENSPDGTNKATLLTSISGDYGGFCRSLNSITYSLGAYYTVSAFVKKGNWRYVSLDFNTLRPVGNAVPFFDLDTLTFDANGSTTVGRAISFPNGWVRLVVSGTTNAAAATTTDFILTSSTGVPGTDIGAGRTAYVWGYQVEVGRNVSSYIPTTIDATVRALDVCSVPTTQFGEIWNTKGGTFFIEFQLAQNIAGSSLRILSHSLSKRWLYANFPGSGFTNEALVAWDGSAKVYFSDVRLTNKNKIAISVEGSTCRASLNGSTISTISHDGSLFNIVSPVFEILANNTGIVTEVKYYIKNMSDTTLQALTTTTTETLLLGTEQITLYDEGVTITL